MLRADRRQTHDSHSAMLSQLRSEVTPAIHNQFVTQLRQPLARFLVIGFDAAVPSNDAAPANVCDSQGFSRRRFANPRHCFFSRQLFIHSSQREKMLFLRMALADKFTPGLTHSP